MKNNKKNYYIAVDMEGLPCVVGTYGAGVTENSPCYQIARREATREANAAARALFESGAETVVVWDNHGTGINLIYDELDERVLIVNGAGSKKRFPEMDSSFAGVIYIGYHAYDTPYATLAHVYSSTAFQYQKVNGKSVGEMQIDGAIAGRIGVPVIFASSDDMCIAQAKESFPWITTCEVKKCLAWGSAMSKHPKAVENEIYESIKNAVANISDCELYKFTEPFEYEVRYKRTEYAIGSSLRSYDNKPFEVVDAYTRRGSLMIPEHIFEF